VFIPVEIWFRAFVLTLVVEAPVVALLLRRWEPSRPRLLVLIVFANLASHPAVWFVFSQLLDIGTQDYVLAVEAWAIASEALFYSAAIRGLPVRQAIVASLVANTASYLVGLLAVALWPQLFW
jgi:hypothetical protein